MLQSHPRDHMHTFALQRTHLFTKNIYKTYLIYRFCSPSEKDLKDVAQLRGAGHIRRQGGEHLEDEGKG